MALLSAIMRHAGMLPSKTRESAERFLQAQAQTRMEQRYAFPGVSAPGEQVLRLPTEEELFGGQLEESLTGGSSGSADTPMQPEAVADPTPAEEIPTEDLVPFPTRSSRNHRGAVPGFEHSVTHTGEAGGARLVLIVDFLHPDLEGKRGEHYVGGQEPP